jgi:hypothetical protein
MYVLRSKHVTASQLWHELGVYARAVTAWSRRASETVDGLSEGEEETAVSSGRYEPAAGSAFDHMLHVFGGSDVAREPGRVVPGSAIET